MFFPMIDAHCHLEHMDAGEIVKEAKKRGMSTMVTSIADIKDKEKVLELKRKYSGFVYICLGFHPEIMDKYGENDIDSYMDFIRKNRDYISAIGEVGLDYSWVTKAGVQERSKEIFIRFIELSKELGLPLVIHSRNGRDNKEGSNDGIGDAIKILSELECDKVMMHCFSGSESQLKTCIAQGWMISLATVLVKSFKHQRLAKIIPLDQLLLETDSPWLDPDGQPGSRELTNRPWKIERSAQVLADVLNISKEGILETTAENAKRFFGMN